MLVVDVAIAQDNIIYTLVNARLGLVAEVIQSLTQTLFTFIYIEKDREFLCVESLITDVTKYIKLCVCQHRLRQTHHLTV